jgi:hypothetical protein
LQRLWRRDGRHGLRQPDGLHRQRQPQTGQPMSCKRSISLGGQVGRFSDGEVRSNSSRTCAARTSSSCSRPARRPTTT